MPPLLQHFRRDPDIAAQIPSTLSKVVLAADSYAKIATMTQQNQLDVLNSCLGAIEFIKRNQIGSAHSALDNIGYDETDTEQIEDDGE